MAANIFGSPDHMPDLVIDKILKVLPTKVAIQVSFVSKQWEGVMSSAPALNFDEDDDLDRHNLNRYSDYLHQHNRFINFLLGYVEYRDNTKLIDKLRLHTRMFTCQDAATINRWLELAIEGDVKELDISPKMSVDPKQYREDALSERWVERYDHYCWYRIPWVTLVNAKSLTSLNLECMRVPDIRAELDIERAHALLPSLKIMSFTTVTFSGYSFFPVLWDPSSIEYLSLTACSFESHDPMCYVESSSLKCLEVKYCHGLKFIIVHEAMNLESLTFVSPPPPYSKCIRVTVNNTPNLRKIDICVDELGELYLWQCHRALKATINTQNLNQFRFYGSLEAQVSVKACWKSIISVSELWDEEWFCSNSTNLSTLMDFLKGFGCCKKVWLCTRDFKAFIFPETFRKKTTGTLATPLPKSCILNVAMLNPPTARSRDYWDLKDSMNWIAHSARIVRDNPRWLVKYLEEGGKQAN